MYSYGYKLSLEVKMNKLLNLFLATIIVLSSTPFVFADDWNNTTTVQVGREYKAFDQIVDRVKLAFTFQEERKIELINHIEERRSSHYSFLISQGKTIQAERFGNKTIGLVRNFEQWKTKRGK